jgi:GH35 family endo-1,4-beta-xylanase
MGHCLVWHAQTPPWVFEESPGKPVSREGLLQGCTSISAQLWGATKVELRVGM